MEVSSGLIILWQFRHRLPDRERQALRMLAVSFFALAIGLRVGPGACYRQRPGQLAGRDRARDRLADRDAAAVAGQRRTGKALGSRAVVADSTQTLLCSYLSAVLLAGLLLNATLGWAEPDRGSGDRRCRGARRHRGWKGNNCCADPGCAG